MRSQTGKIHLEKTSPFRLCAKLKIKPLPSGNRFMFGIWMDRPAILIRFSSTGDIEQWTPVRWFVRLEWSLRHSSMAGDMAIAHVYYEWMDFTWRVNTSDIMLIRHMSLAECIKYYIHVSKYSQDALRGCHKLTRAPHNLRVIFVGMFRAGIYTETHTRASTSTPPPTHASLPRGRQFDYGCWRRGSSTAQLARRCE